MRLVGILAAVLFAGCSTIDYQNRVEGWPILKQVIHVVSQEEMRAVCGQYVGVGSVVLACVEITFDPAVCDVWITEANGWAEEHERAHCEGYQHPGSNKMTEMLREWNQQRRNKLNES